MIKIKSIKFKNHEILGNLELDFCDKNGNPVDTVIIAGENGTGKTTVLEEIYNIMEYDTECKNLELEIICNNIHYNIKYGEDLERRVGITLLGKTFYDYRIEYLNCNNQKMKQHNSKFKEITNFSSIYSTVNINFNIVRSSINKFEELDREGLKNIKFNSETATSISKLLEDVRADDAERTLQAVEKNKNPNSIEIKMDRFNNAFNYIFENSLTFKEAKRDERNNCKKVIFNKNNQEICIDNLSSGEKQIVFRGAFLLRDKESLNGAVVLIDEPEISMHPEWQKKIMEFYKRIFKDKNGNQTSQIIVTTHSPFIIHNENRYNDKVIVLKKTDEGIVVSDKAEYYSANTIQAVEDAFNIQNFLSNHQDNTVFVEGKTDEQYFNKAIEVFGFKDLPFKFKAIGGENKIKKAYKTLTEDLNLDLKYKIVFLYDFDVKAKNAETNNCYIRSLLEYTNQIFTKGIENALVIDENLSEVIKHKDRNKFYSKKQTNTYGEKYEYFEKQTFCDYICSLDNEKLKVILKNLKEEIKKLEQLFYENK